MNRKGISTSYSKPATASSTMASWRSRRSQRFYTPKMQGPYEITFDIVFRKLTCHERAQKPGKLTKERIAKRYNIKPENVVAPQFFRQAEASKCTIPRGGTAGSFGDKDLNASQQYAPRLGIRV
jgi:hypothetical protein